MKVLSLRSTKRETVGKGSARLLRREGFIPAILYGPGVTSLNLTLELSELMKILRSSKTSQFLLDLSIDETVKKVTIKELQSSPVSSEILHVDFYEVAMDRKIKVAVPVTTEGKSKGVELGGMLQLIRHEISVLCLPDSIPESVSVDITDLDIGDSFHVMDLSLVDGIEIAGDANFTILTILSQKAEQDDNVEKTEENGELEEAEVV